MRFVEGRTVKTAQQLVFLRNTQIHCLRKFESRSVLDIWKINKIVGAISK